MQFRTSLIVLLTLIAHSRAISQQMPIPNQYKRVHQTALKAIVGGEAAKTEKMLHEFLQQWPDDPESYYMLTVMYAQTNRVPAAIETAERAIELGLPAERFIAGTKTLLEPLADTEFITGLRRRFAFTPLHGPMLGNVTEHSVSIWLRTAKATQVCVVSSRSADMSNPTYSPAVTTAPATDFTAVVTVDGLEPSTDYYYQVEIDGHLCETHPPLRMRTFPSQNQPAKFRFVFGGGAGYVPPNERAWNVIRNQQPDLLLLLGDNVYSDDPKTPEMQHYCYYRRQSRPEFRQLVQSTPVYSIWDDHDFGTNDCAEAGF
jgi:alkaline phosphatase D